MGLVRDRDGKRLHIKSKLMGESLLSRSFAEGYEVAPQQRLFPDVNVIKLGGQSICDLGKKSLPAIVREISGIKDRHRMLLTTGGGTRSRHIYAIGLELGMPTGIISKFGSSVSEQNALLVATLLSPWGGIKIGHDEIMKLPTYFSQGCIPVMHGMPPYDYFAIPSPQWRIPLHRTDVGTLIIADLIGARSCIFVKDEKGLYTDNPKKNPRAEFIPAITAGEILSMDLDDLIIERTCLEILQNSEVLDQIQVVNGLVEENISRALEGEHVGTIIRKG
ncbi:MAG TPA: uridine kinase [Syntrophales bacterium]|nr:uridine kinase [Syntrophales bacterium]HOX93167.1 uridine kinase [Syntrophales bacterium]HPI57654.1 uridine kinase [Syntrophales bacterium]HPN25333.1 uridine kinase [Syntrophales bacterium]HQM29625.1 uridine kinase [Syntrophales bacterium]